MGKKVLVDLSHPFGANMPIWPYFKKPAISTMHTLAKSGVLSQEMTIVQHCGTHADSPRHVLEYEFDGSRARYTHEMDLSEYYGDAVCLDVKIHPWGLISAADLDDAVERSAVTHADLEGKTSKPITQEYLEKFGEEAYAWFHKETFIKLHGQERYDELYGEIEEKAGCVGTWEPCHKLMLGNGITGWENVGGDIDKVVGKRFKIMGFPIRWVEGDGSMVRLVAEIDEDDLNDVPDRVYKYGDH